MRISQTPRQGVYAGFNDCIKLARGEYVYIATSDDTMMPDCLEKMMVALETNPDCGLCQCGLEVIDEKGQPHSWMRWRDFAFGRFAQEWLIRPHIRRAPLDGILHFALQTIYTSITQLLIRRQVFHRVGLFDGTWGAKGDFEWGMRAGLLEDCVFIPDLLATWRVHPQQATGNTESSAVRGQMLDMARAAFKRAQKVPGNKLAPLSLDRLLQFDRDQVFQFGLQEAGSRSRRLAFLMRETLHGNINALKYIFSPQRNNRFWEAEQFARLHGLFEELNVSVPIFI
jgi:glycosyltransferase involved in cell wall biosynthesis